MTLACRVRLSTHQSSNIHSLTHILGTFPLIWLVVTFLSQFAPNTICASASHPSPGDNPPQREREVTKTTGTVENGRVALNHLHICTGDIFHSYAPVISSTGGIPFFRALSRSLPKSSIHLHATKCHLETIYPTQPRSTPYPPSTFFRHQHSSNHTVLIHSHHVSKLSQHSVIPSTHHLPSYSMQLLKLVFQLY